MQPLLLLALYLVVTLLPLGLAAFGARPPRGFWDEAATAAGMLAFSVILAEFLLSGRFRAISRRIGMDVTMRFHQLLARTALALALIHPFLYQSAFNPAYPWDETRQLTVTSDIDALWTGIVAYLLLPAFVVLSIWREKIPYRYETWRLMHGLAAVAIAGALLDHTLAAGRYSADPALAWVWIALFALAVASLVFVYFIKPVLQARRPWRLKAVRPAAAKTWEVTLTPDGHDGLAYTAGQFAWIKLGAKPFSLREHPFSIASAPAEGAELQFVVKELGDFTSRIGELETGVACYVDGPHGNLTLKGRDEPGVALIAGGVGLAPLLGILRQMAAEDDARPILLVYGNRVAEQIAYESELEALGKKLDLTVVQVLSEPPPGWTGEVGLVDAELIAKVVSPEAARDWLFALCGPPAMMNAVEQALLAQGASARRILSERFTYD